MVKNNENSERFCRSEWIFSRVKWNKMRALHHFMSRFVKWKGPQVSADRTLSQNKIFSRQHSSMENIARWNFWTRFFPIRVIVRYFCARLLVGEFTNEVSFLLNCSSHSSFFLFEITFQFLGTIAIKRSVRARRGPWLRVKILSLQGRGSE